jgi:hypothetical protein
MFLTTVRRKKEMTSLTQTVASLNDALVPSLSFQLPKAASYVVSRQSQHMYPTGGSEFRPVGGTSLIRINLTTTSGGWWDPLTCRLRFKLTNNTNLGPPNNPPDSFTSKLSFLGPPGIIFQRWRLLCGGTVVQDTGVYGSREYYLWMNLLRDSIRAAQDQMEAPWTKTYNGTTDWSIKGVPDAPANSRYYCIPLHLGIFNQPLFWDGSAAPMVLELQLHTDPSAPFSVLVDDDGDVLPRNSPDWSISEVSFVGDVISLESSFQNNFDSLLLSGSTIPLPFKACYTQFQTVVPGTDSIQVIAQRAFSRVSAILVHFQGAQPPAATILPQKLRPFGNSSVFTSIPLNCKDVNYFAGPTGQDPATYGDILEAQLHIGGMVVPSMPQRGLSTQFMYLRQALNQEYQGNISISTLNEYGSVSYILGFQLERAPRDSSFSGVSLMSGSTVTLQLRNLLPPGSTPQGFMQNGMASVTGVYLTFIYDSVLDISGAGASIQM